MRRATLHRWLGLALGLALMGCGVLALHRTSASASDVMALSQARGLESDAYFYSEVSDVGAFLEDDGRYAHPSMEAR